ncbi:hypothetical protein SporoP37_15705 [Sporosarcina sp. P37]|uniref:hypothetical protein n=1 Tax=unclassified Sporosarcina TaxID=2647733 RepID=UPI000A17E85F|nr:MULTISPECIES: hypothetical protein [unclassified Sporosarcina]ARK25973.1 hypothetical protein SporoP37_15705 [Sporosarcina sp. P37]PID19341.1 hypothetical protein CSV62_02225 [Sporosarcina sp. P35]
MEDINSLVQNHLPLLHKKIQKERKSASIKEVEKMYSAFYMYVRLYGLTDRSSEEVNLKAVLEDTITFLVQFADKQIEESIDRLQPLYSLLNSFLLMYSMDKQQDDYSSCE